MHTLFYLYQAPRITTPTNLFHKGIIVGYIFEVGIDIDLIVDFKFEGVVKYEYSCATTNVYGAKLNSNSVIVPYFHKESSASKHTFSMVGEAGVKVGVNLEVYASFVGLSKFVYVDIYAEAGVYAELKGVLHYSVSNGWDSENGDSETKTEFYNALYLEVGMYYDVGIGYKVFLWGNQISILGGEKKIPLLALGYDKVYYNYAGTVESLKNYLAVFNKYYFFHLLTNLFAASSSFSTRISASFSVLPTPKLILTVPSISFFCNPNASSVPLCPFLAEQALPAEIQTPYPLSRFSTTSLFAPTIDSESM